MIDADHDRLIQVDMKVESAHKRVDNMKEDIETFKTTVTNSFEAIQGKLDGLLTLKDKLLGGSVVVMFIITTGLSIYTVLK